LIKVAEHEARLAQRRSANPSLAQQERDAGDDRAKRKSARASVARKALHMPSPRRRTAGAATAAAEAGTKGGSGRPQQLSGRLLGSPRQGARMNSIDGEINGSDDDDGGEEDGVRSSEDSEEESLTEDSTEGTPARR